MQDRSYDELVHELIAGRQDKDREQATALSLDELVYEFIAFNKEKAKEI